MAKSVTNLRPTAPAAHAAAAPREGAHIPTQELFLPVHGHVTLSPKEIAIIDHPSFQRLRRVRQLGFAHVVFPGGTHTRLEHSIGAVHVAQMILEHVNSNYRNPKVRQKIGDWEKTDIKDAPATLIRLGALLHDIGHLPFGHTLEDELSHLPSHDGPERLKKIGERKYPHYELAASLGTPAKPTGGWSLCELIDQLYRQEVTSLGIDRTPFDVLCGIICKAPKNEGEAKDAWDSLTEVLSKQIPLQVCRDIVGNTICADFLDYLYRDWYHLGKPIYEDKRLYQYMEARTKMGEDGRPISYFVINVGAAAKVRHDALTNILELLEGRYKLAETVLFHRTKLAITALLDRCLLEIRELHKTVGIDEAEFAPITEKLLLDGADDALPEILATLAKGGTEGGCKKIEEAIVSERKQLNEALKETRDLLSKNAAGEGDGHPKSAVELRLAEIFELIDRLKDRRVCTLAYKLRISDFVGPHTPENPQLKRLIKIYRDPENRLRFLRGMEALCGMPPGSLLMYCPPNAAMNAKIAKVNLLIEGEVTPFDKYDSDGEDSSLTRGALWAQVRRFYELWSTQLFVDHSVWDRLSPTARQHFESLLENFLFQMDQDTDATMIRNQMEPSVLAVSKEGKLLAARDKSGAPNLDKLEGFVFPSGLPFTG